MNIQKLIELLQKCPDQDKEVYLSISDRGGEKLVSWGQISLHQISKIQPGDYGKLGDIVLEWKY